MFPKDSPLLNVDYPKHASRIIEECYPRVACINGCGVTMRNLKLEEVSSKAKVGGSSGVDIQIQAKERLSI